MRRDGDGRGDVGGHKAREHQMTKLKKAPEPFLIVLAGIVGVLLSTR